MSNFDSLADQLDAFLGGKKKKRQSEAPNFLFIPPRIVIIRSWLSTNTKMHDGYYMHLFQPPVGDLLPQKKNSGVIVHNHDESQTCASPHFCFEWGYEPPTGEKFSDFFWRQNAKYYGIILPDSQTSTEKRVVLGDVPSNLSTLFNF